MQEKFKKQMEKSAKEGNTFAKAMIESLEKKKEATPEETKEDWDWSSYLIGMLFVIGAFLGVLFVIGVIFLAIIKWAFSMVF